MSYSTDTTWHAALTDLLRRTHLADPDGEVATEVLHPGDRLLIYTDGVAEARSRDGQAFGLDGLIDLIDATAVPELAAPETLRRLAHGVLAECPAPPADDITLFLVEWSTMAAERTQP